MTEYLVIQNYSVDILLSKPPMKLWCIQTSGTPKGSHMIYELNSLVKNGIFGCKFYGSFRVS